MANLKYSRQRASIKEYLAGIKVQQAARIN